MVLKPWFCPDCGERVAVQSENTKRCGKLENWPEGVRRHWPSGLPAEWGERRNIARIRHPDLDAAAAGR